MEVNLTQSVLVALIIGLSSGSIGAFVILRRMALVGDALSHVALPGIALALAYGIDPFWGVLAFMIIAAFAIAFIQSQVKLPTEAVVGILFTASLAVGVLTIPNEEILESLFGEFPQIPYFMFAAIAVSALAFTVFTFLLSKQFIFSSASTELFEIRGRAWLYNLAFLLIFAVIVALGIKLMGVLLAGALTIIPAVSAKTIASSMKSYIVLSAVLGSAIAVFGLLISYSYNFLPGPTIILLGISLFFVLFIKKMLIK